MSYRILKNVTQNVVQQMYHNENLEVRKLISDAIRATPL